MTNILLHAPVLNPAGPIARTELELLALASALMLLVMVPVFSLVFLFAWRYRASNRSSRYEPDWAYSSKIDAAVWFAPATIIVILGGLVWRYTHKLDPYRSPAQSTPPLEVQAVAQDWKWLFIYPTLHIATVNELAFPSGQSVLLRITSDTAMNSLMIPGLAGQIYAMAGMETRMNFLADHPARLIGRNMQYSGGGFPGQYFGVSSLTGPDFETWIEKVRTSAVRLDASTYQELSRPSRRHPVTYYASVQSGLFSSIIQKYLDTRAPEHDQ